MGIDAITRQVELLEQYKETIAPAAGINRIEEILKALLDASQNSLSAPIGTHTIALAYNPLRDRLLPLQLYFYTALDLSNPTYIDHNRVRDMTLQVSNLSRPLDTVRNFMNILI
jgi:hypothetical protein